MNRRIAIPCLLSLLAFAAVYLAQASPDPDYAVQDGAYRGSGSTAQTRLPASAAAEAGRRPMLSADEAQAMLLDGWPTLGKHRLMSRARPKQRLYAHASNYLQGWETQQPTFLCELTISVNHVWNCYAVSIDRLSNGIAIFNGNRWQDYDSWRDTNLKKFQAQTSGA